MRYQTRLPLACRMAASIAVAALLFAATKAPAATYYLSPTGSDSNSGSAAAPWKTLAKAAGVLQPGDTALLNDGDYAGGFKHTRPGTAAAPITYRAINQGKAVLRGDLTTATDGMLVYNTENIVVDGLNFYKWKKSGISVKVCKKVVVRNCIGRNCEYWGIFTSHTDDLLLEDNVCYGSVLQHGIYVSNSGDRPIVRRNVCYGNYRAGIQLNGDGSMLKPDLGTRGDGIIDGAQVYANVLYDNGPLAGAINLASVRNSLFANNLIYNNTSKGIAAFDDNDGYIYGCKNNRFVYNTIYFRPNEGGWCFSFKHGSTGNTVSDNILWGGYRGAYEFDDSSGVTCDRNVIHEVNGVGVATNESLGKFYSFIGWRSVSGNDLHSTTASPKFLNATTSPYDFHVASDSPAVDAGLFLAEVADDIAGAARPQGAAPDCGAYEGASSGSGGGGGDAGGGGTSAPTGLTATVFNLLRVNLTWNPTSMSATYTVKRSLTQAGPYSKLATGLSKTSYNTGNLISGTLYWFTVSATENGVEGPDSAPVSILIP